MYTTVRLQSHADADKSRDLVCSRKPWAVTSYLINVRFACGLKTLSSAEFLMVLADLFFEQEPNNGLLNMHFVAACLISYKIMDTKRKRWLTAAVGMDIL